MAKAHKNESINRFDFFLKLPLIKKLRYDDAREIIDAATEEHYKMKHFVFRQDAPSDSLYFVYSGEFEVSRNQKKKQNKMNQTQQGMIA